MKKRLPLILLFLLPLILLIFGLFWVCREKGHFCLRKITASLPVHPEWETVVEGVPEEALTQTYTYLKGGTQAYSFVSEDQKYVLKFFKMSHLLPKTWLNYIPIPYLLDRYRYAKIDKHQADLKTTFEGYKLAYDHLKEETALIVVHLNPTKNLYKEVTVIDRQKRTHRIPLDRVPFILQKKAELITAKIANEENIERIRSAVLRLVERRCQKGFSDGDGEICRNYGFIGEECVQFDVGRLYPDEAMKDPAAQEREVQRIQKKLEVLINSCLP